MCTMGVAWDSFKVWVRLKLKERNKAIVRTILYDFFLSKGTCALRSKCTHVTTNANFNGSLVIGEQLYSLLKTTFVLMLILTLQVQFTTWICLSSSIMKIMKKIMAKTISHMATAEYPP